MQSLPDLIAPRLPRRPYCTDNLKHGLVIRPPEVALGKNYVQLNPPILCHWLVFDIDEPMAALAWEKANVAPPNWITVNPENTRAHIGYLLEVPVMTAPEARDKPLRYAAAIEAAFRVALGADPCYRGLIAKNPLSPAWKTWFLHAEAYSLDYLAEWVTLSRTRTPMVVPTGLWRNVQLFDAIRQWAYGMVRVYQQVDAGLAQWFRAVLREAEVVNKRFETPLMLSEVRATAKSVAKWTWQHFSEASFSRIQQARARRRWAQVRESSQEQSQPWLALGISRRTYFYWKKAILLEHSSQQPNQETQLVCCI